MAESTLVNRRAEPRRQPNLLLVVVAVSVALNLALAGFVAIRELNIGGSPSNTAAFSRTAYYAVFLNNKEAFVGHITSMDGSGVSMSDIYYLTFEAKDAAGKAIANPKPEDYQPALKKLGNEVWGPKDFVQINRQNMEYYTELRPDSKIVQAIQAFQTPKK